MIANTRQVIECAANETVLHAARIAGVDFPYAWCQRKLRNLRLSPRCRQSLPATEQ
jgi:hypothetical protein